jgi:hypothetical protein
VEELLDLSVAEGKRSCAFWSSMVSFAPYPASKMTSIAAKRRCVIAGHTDKFKIVVPTWYSPLRWVGFQLFFRRRTT